MCNNEIISVLVHTGVGMNGGVGLCFVIGRISAEILGALEINRDHALALASADDLVDVHFIIGDDVFVGSDTQLVAPVEVGAGATIGAGTTVTKNVAPNTLVITRAKLREIEGWKRPQKIKK